MNGKAIFNLQRFLILQTKVNPQTKDTIPDYYVYAWYTGIFPFFEEGDLHEDLEEYFKITKKQVDIISKFLDDEWRNKKLYTFYELEEHFKCWNNPVENIDRYVLICVLRYMYLRGGFDKDFWKKMLEPMQYPVEAESITRDFNVDEIYFI